MKFISASLLTLVLSVSALANPVPEADANAGELEKRAATCSITTDGARCRRTPSLSADIIGTFGIGRSLSFSCWKAGASVNGVITWDRTTVNGVACYISDTLVSLPCPSALPKCA